MSDATSDRSVAAFAPVLFALSIPLWWIGVVSPRQLLPGLPATTALLVFCPLVAATLLVYRERGPAGV